MDEVSILLNYSFTLRYQPLALHFLVFGNSLVFTLLFLSRMISRMRFGLVDIY